MLRGAVTATRTERWFLIDNLLVRIHLIIMMIWWTGLAPWQFEFPFSGSLRSTFLVPATDDVQMCQHSVISAREVKKQHEKFKATSDDFAY